eukprot:752843-Hanusia_phi.AAC.5
MYVPTAPHPPPQPSLHYPLHHLAHLFASAMFFIFEIFKNLARPASGSVNPPRGYKPALPVA